MKAVYLEKAGEAPKVVERPEPELRPGGAIVKILAAPVLSFMKKVLSGELGYAMATPWIPGSNGVGVVEKVADDVPGIQRGDRVFIDPHIYSHTTTDVHDGVLLGLTALGPEASSTQQRWRHGTFAGKTAVPAECLTVIPESISTDAARLAVLSFAAIAYGGLLKGNFRPGQKLIVSGATGNIGSCGLLVGLAMGASRVVALGREESVLQQLKALDPRRVATVKLENNLERDKEAVAMAAGGADLVYDMLGNVPTFVPTAAAVYALRRGGTAVLMGGVKAAIDLPYFWIMTNEISIRGALMYPRSAPRELLEMMGAGVLDLSSVKLRSFRLEEIEPALDDAERSRGPSYTVLVPESGAAAKA